MQLDDHSRCTLKVTLKTLVWLLLIEKSPWTLEATARQFLYAILLFTLHSHMFVRLCFAASWALRDMRTDIFSVHRRNFLFNLPELSFYFFSIVFDSLTVTHVLFVGALFADKPGKNIAKAVFSIKISARARNESKKFREKQKLSRVFWVSQQSFQFCRFYFAAKISVLWVSFFLSILCANFFRRFFKKIRKNRFLSESIQKSDASRSWLDSSLTGETLQALKIKKVPRGNIHRLKKIHLASSLYTK